METVSFGDFVEAMLWYVENPELTSYIVKVSAMNRRERFEELQTMELSTLSEPSKKWMRMVLTGDTASRVVTTLDHFSHAYGVSLY